VSIGIWINAEVKSTAARCPFSKLHPRGECYPPWSNRVVGRTFGPNYEYPVSGASALAVHSEMRSGQWVKVAVRARIDRVAESGRRRCRSSLRRQLRKRTLTLGIQAIQGISVERNDACRSSFATIMSTKLSRH
jgi:hypothetical protein